MKELLKHIYQVLDPEIKVKRSIEETLGNVAGKYQNLSTGAKVAVVGTGILALLGATNAVTANVCSDRSFVEGARQTEQYWKAADSESYNRHFIGDTIELSDGTTIETGVMRNITPLEQRTLGHDGFVITLGR
jgi:hypothetical protein